MPLPLPRHGRPQRERREKAEPSLLARRSSYTFAELWHLTSLDAPLVAVAWTFLLGFSTGTPAPLADLLSLGLAVWMIYATDRLLDAHHATTDLRHRHHFHRRHAALFYAALLLAAPLLLDLVLHLPSNLRTAWMLLALPLALYFGSVHLTKKKVPKEFLVAILFAAACAIPAALNAPDTKALFSVLTLAALFALLCLANCVAIARWERDRIENAALLWIAQRFSLLCGLIAVFALVQACTMGFNVAAMAVALSALLLLTADRGLSQTAEKLHLRVLADALLLTPLILLPLLPTVRHEVAVGLHSVFPVLHAAAMRLGHLA